ncbi:unnamed protein product [Ectocarpus sp. CCAP 1310/34]|nr:unnamed protein product [Ectocarpus sp. CCAP 1310/34]
MTYICLHLDGISTRSTKSRKLAGLILRRRAWHMRGWIRTGPSPQALHRTPIRLLERLLDSHSACALAASQAWLGSTHTPDRPARAGSQRRHTTPSLSTQAWEESRGARRQRVEDSDSAATPASIAEEHFGYLGWKWRGNHFGSKLPLCLFLTLHDRGNGHKIGTGADVLRWVREWLATSRYRDVVTLDITSQQVAQHLKALAQKHKLGKAINKIQLEKFMESLEHLPQEAVPPTRDNPYGGQEARNMAYARTRSSQGQGGHAFLRAAPTDRAREIPSNEFVYATRRALGVEEFLAERCPSATSDGIAAQASEARKRQHYARPGHVSFDERSFKLTSLAVESFGRLGEEGYEFIDELATHAVGGRDGGTMALKGVFKERLLQIVSVATQVAISRRVQRYKLALRGRQDAENRRTRSTSDQSTPMIWGWSVDAS